MMPVKFVPAEKQFELDSDESLVIRARSGDQEAFRILFERHRQVVYRFVYQMSNNRDAAEDLTQEVFVRAHQNLIRYRDEARFTTWLLRIATNLATDRLRMNQRRFALENQESGSNGALNWMTVRKSEDPVENLETERRRQAVREALVDLPEHHKRAIILRDIEEQDYKDIAEILSCTLGGAKLRVLRARRALRDRVFAILEEESN